VGSQARSQLQTVWRYTGVTAENICERPLAYRLVHKIKYTIVFVREVGFLLPSGADNTDHRTIHRATDRHAACQRTATANMDPFPTLRAGAFVTSLARVKHSSPSTAVLSKTSHANCCTTLTNRPLRPREGRFVRVLQQLACEVFERTAVSFYHPLNTQPLALFFPMCGLVTVPTVSAQCACLTARSMPWWAFFVLACLAPVSR